jgi:hypothetical protein
LGTKVEIVRRQVHPGEYYPTRTRAAYELFIAREGIKESTCRQKEDETRGVGNGQKPPASYSAKDIQVSRPGRCRRPGMYIGTTDLRASITWCGRSSTTHRRGDERTTDRIDL